MLPLDKAVAMINHGHDRPRARRQGLHRRRGHGNQPAELRWSRSLRAVSDLHIDFSDTTGYGSSDHTSFTTKQVPVLFFFSGLHGDYHKPSDTWDKIDAPDAAKLLDLIAEVGTTLREEADRPQFVRVKEPDNPHAGAMAGSSQSGYGPYFGSIPDFTEMPNGVRFADVRDGSPAAKAGLKAGDILMEFDGKPIQNLYDFTYALRSKKPGDEVTVKVLRGTETVTASVLLRERK